MQAEVALCAGSGLCGTGVLDLAIWQFWCGGRCSSLWPAPSQSNRAVPLAKFVTQVASAGGREARGLLGGAGELESRD